MNMHRDVSAKSGASRTGCSTAFAKCVIAFSSAAFQCSTPGVQHLPTQASLGSYKTLPHVRTAVDLFLGVTHPDDDTPGGATTTSAIPGGVANSGAGSPQGTGIPKGGALPPLTRTFLQEVVERLLDIVFPLLYIFEPEGMLDSYKNLRVLWVRALLAAAGEIDDPMAARLLPAATRWVVSAPLARTIWVPVLPKLEWPGVMSYGIQRRTEFIDEALGAFLASNADSKSQIVLIGAGYDTRTARYQASGVNFYEVDLPEVIAMKGKMTEQLEEMGGSVMDGRTLGVNLNEATLSPPGVFAQLELLGLNRKIPTLVVMEAVLLYLSPSAKRALLADAGAFASANVMSAVVLADNLSPFVSAPRAADTAAFLAPLGLSLKKHDWMFGGVMQFVCATGVNVENPERGVNGLSA